MLDTIYHMTFKLLNKRAIVALNRSPVLCAPVIYAYVTPRDAHFWPQGHYLNKVGGGQLVDATYQKYQGFSPCGFLQEDLIMFTLM